MEKLPNINSTSSIIIYFKVHDFLFYEKFIISLKNFFTCFFLKIINTFSEIVFQYIYLQLKFTNKTSKKYKILNIIFKNSDLDFYDKIFSNHLFEYFLKTHLTKMENQVLKFLILNIDETKIYNRTGMDSIFINKRIEGIRKKFKKFMEKEDFHFKNYTS